MPGLVRALSLAGRLGFAVSIALLALGVSRWAPIGAQPPLDVRALPLAGPALGFAILAGGGAGQMSAVVPNAERRRSTSKVAPVPIAAVEPPNTLDPHFAKVCDHYG